MIRDMDLIRELLLRIEAAGPHGIDEWITIDGYDQPTIAYHVDLLAQRGIIKAYVLRADGVPPIAARIESLTWEGHEFLGKIRNDTVWQKTRAVIAEKGGGVSIEIVAAVAMKIAKAHFGVG
jgi:Hypothetical protein (DUF2513)